MNRVGALDTIGAMHRRVASRRPWLRFAAFLVCVAGCVAPAEVAAQTVSYARRSSGFPTATHHDGTNTLTLAAALDRAGAAYYVVVRQPNGMTGGSVIEPRQGAEIFAGTSSGGAVDDVFASISPSRPLDVDRQVLVDALPDLAIYNIYVATHTGDPTVANDGVASPAATTAALIDAATILRLRRKSALARPARLARVPLVIAVAPQATSPPPRTSSSFPRTPRPPLTRPRWWRGRPPMARTPSRFTIGPCASRPAPPRHLQLNATGQTDSLPGTRTRCTWRSRTRRRFPTSRPRWRR